MNLSKQYLILFLKKGFYFFILLIVLLLCLVFFSNQKLKNQKQRYTLNNNIETLILGHSHVEYAYNDSIIKDAINLGQGGDSYFYSYLKIKQILKSSPQLKTIFIEFSNNQIDAKMDEWIWDDIHLNSKFRKLSAFLDFEDTKLLMKNNLKGFLANVGLGTRKNLELIFNPVNKVYLSKDWGGYKPNYSSKIDSIIKFMDTKNKQQLNKKPYGYPLSNNNIYYLQKALMIIKAYDVKVFFIRTPVHERYHYLANEVKFDSVYQAHFDSIPFLDFKDYPLFNEQFADDSHLNIKGAKELSETLQQLINQGILNSKEPKQLIDSVIATLIQKRHVLYKPNYGYSLHHDN